MADGLARKGFDLDLRDGESAEGSLARLLRAGGNLVEVKMDCQAHQTRRVFLEYRHRGRQSGIAVTEAAWWAFALPGLDTYVITATERMRRLGRTAHRNPALRMEGGDYNLSHGVFVPSHWLVEPEP